jgi:hypothetical protein
MGLRCPRDLAVTAVAARRQCVRQLQAKGVSERQACRLVGISTSVLRYQTRQDGTSPCESASKSWQASTAATAIECCTAG